ncbi:MAG TPA: Wzz/FepE/Etk N-terminal domain-containing protein [Caproiciproducens sp.]|nr:Wzz/FepE/Etk N-terminal domain-containing protein [Caproiciproducens sp.]
MELSVKDLFRIIRKNFILLLICGLIGLGGSYSISRYLMHPTYISTVKLYVYTKGDSTQSANYNYLNDLNYAQKVVNTYIEMLRTNSFYKSVKDKANLDYSIDELKDMISFSVLNDTEVFQVSVSSHKPEEAKNIADTVTALAPQTISAIKESALLKVVDSATFPTAPSSPKILQNSMIGFILGLAAAFFYAFLRETLDVRIKQEEDLSTKYPVPILGSIPDFGAKNQKNNILGKDIYL